jgi:uncharacterized protein (DUF2235 family)
MKNIIICCDGTGNEIGSEVTNVFRINRIADESGPHQVVYYDEGIGTENEPKPWGRLTQKIGATLAQATGSGIERKVIGAYEFLMLNYQPKDRIFLFGFSRGAYAVRMLAAMIHKIGLLPPSKRNLIGKGLIRFEQFSSRQGDDGTTIKTSENDRSDEAYMFGRLSKSRWITIDFVGVWDTVASLIRPRPKTLIFLASDISPTRAAIQV